MPFKVFGGDAKVLKLSLTLFWIVSFQIRDVLLQI